MTISAPLSRREAITAGATIVAGFYLAPHVGRAQMPGPPPPAGPPDPNAFIAISPADDTVMILSKHIEFGQGPYTGISTLIAEEMDADWAKVRAGSAPAGKAYGNVLFGGMQGTGGSTAMASSWQSMREAGAAARAKLVLAAAQAWGVQPDGISVEKGVITHKASGRTCGFGQVAVAASRLPQPPKVTLKDPKDYTLIGKEGVRKPDTLAKTNGQAVYAIDLKTPGMLTVLVARSPRFGGKVKGFDAAQAMKVKGVVAVKQVPSGVAVYATGMWPAKKGREALQVQWDDSAAEQRSSEAMFADYRKAAAQPGVKVKSHGDAAATLAGATVIEQEYAFPYLAHAPMEPLDGYLEWDGSAARARFGSQIATMDQGAIAQVLGLKPDQVSIEVMLAGGSFGRRATPTAHLAAELAEVAKAIGPNKPVKLVWTREDDITGGHYRPMVVHRFQGAIKDGQITAWSSRTVTQSILAGTPMGMGLKDGIDPQMTEGASEILYKTGSFACEARGMPSPVSTLWWRSVGHSHTGYAVECFVDRLLQADDRDPVDGRLKILDNKRAEGVLKAVAKLADWKGPDAGNGRARGVAVVESFNTYVAEIAEVSIGEDGTPRVHKVWAAVDCGVAINPDVIRAQVEGGVGYALGHALFAEVPFKAGIPAYRNFNEYRSLRINEMPEVEVVIVPSTEKPTGIGEPGVPPLAPAVANALARLGRERPARLPMVRQA